MRVTHSLLAAAFLTGCGGPEAEAPETPGTEPAPDASVAQPAKPGAPAHASAAEPAAPAPASAASGPDVDGPDGVRRWGAWDGPKQGAAVTTKRAWVIAPNLQESGSDKLSFGAVFPRVADVEKASANELVLSEKWGKFAVPLALARPAAAPRALKDGRVVRCPFGGNSVIAITDRTSDSTTVCKFRFMDKPRKEEVPIADVMVFDGTLQLGAPVHARFESEPDVWYDGMAVAADGDSVWATLEIKFGNDDPRGSKVAHKFKKSDVRVVDVRKTFNRGDACVAPDFGRIEPCTVKRILDQGLAYEVSVEGGATHEVEIGRIAPKPRK
jgi:hypothetical protein